MMTLSHQHCLAVLMVVVAVMMRRTEAAFLHHGTLTAPPLLSSSSLYSSSLRPRHNDLSPRNPRKEEDLSAFLEDSSTWGIKRNAEQPPAVAATALFSSLGASLETVPTTAEARLMALAQSASQIADQYRAEVAALRQKKSSFSSPKSLPSVSTVAPSKSSQPVQPTTTSSSLSASSTPDNNLPVLVLVSAAAAALVDPTALGDQLAMVDWTTMDLSHVDFSVLSRVDVTMVVAQLQEAQQVLLSKSAQAMDTLDTAVWDAQMVLQVVLAKAAAAPVEVLARVQQAVSEPVTQMQQVMKEFNVELQVKMETMAANVQQLQEDLRNAIPSHVDAMQQAATDHLQEVQDTLTVKASSIELPTVNVEGIKADVLGHVRNLQNIIITKASSIELPQMYNIEVAQELVEAKMGQVQDAMTTVMDTTTTVLK